jgi:MFS family permease
MLGTSLVQYALMWYVTLETRSGTMMTLFIICWFLPTLLVSPCAGVWADRHDRKRLIALITLALAVAFAGGGKAPWLIFLASALRAVGTAVQGPVVGHPLGMGRVRQPHPHHGSCTRGHGSADHRAGARPSFWLYLAAMVRIEWILLATGALMAGLAIPVLAHRRLVVVGRRPAPSAPSAPPAPAVAAALGDEAPPPLV